MAKKRSAYRKRRKFYGNQFDKNKILSKETILKDESSIQSTVSSADVTNVVDSLSDVVGPSASAKKIKIDSFNPKATKKGLVPQWTSYNVQNYHQRCLLQWLHRLVKTVMS